MLTYIPGETYSERIIVRTMRANVLCWIEYRPAGLYVYGSRHQVQRDWVLKIKRGQGPAMANKCPLKLELESHLRAWMLRVTHRPLALWRFDELRELALGKQGIEQTKSDQAKKAYQPFVHRSS
jgi:hypothetical protein